MTNVFDIRDGSPVEPVPPNYVAPPTMGPEIPGCILQYRKDLYEDARATGPGWGSAILAGLVLNLLGVF